MDCLFFRFLIIMHHQNTLWTYTRLGSDWVEPRWNLVSFTFLSYFLGKFLGCSYSKQIFDQPYVGELESFALWWIKGRNSVPLLEDSSLGKSFHKNEITSRLLQLQYQGKFTWWKETPFPFRAGLWGLYWELEKFYLQQRRTLCTVFQTSLGYEMEMTTM